MARGARSALARARIASGRLRATAGGTTIRMLLPFFLSWWRLGVMLRCLVHAGDANGHVLAPLGGVLLLIFHFSFVVLIKKIIQMNWIANPPTPYRF